MIRLASSSVSGGINRGLAVYPKRVVTKASQQDRRFPRRLSERTGLSWLRWNNAYLFGALGFGFLGSGFLPSITQNVWGMTVLGGALGATLGLGFAWLGHKVIGHFISSDSTNK